MQPPAPTTWARAPQPTLVAAVPRQVRPWRQREQQRTKLAKEWEVYRRRLSRSRSAERHRTAKSPRLPKPRAASP